MNRKITNKIFQQCLHAKLKEVKCGEQFSFDENYSLVVGNCKAITTNELQEMGKGLVMRGLSVARAICTKNGSTCPAVNHLTFRGTNNACVKSADGKSVWTAFGTVTAKCEPANFD